ncbi:MAG: FtsX-like permease family protein [Thermoplasmata archaeon]|nr:FtsX-like permease family protein [Thermoplasmata archaeon]
MSPRSRLSHTALQDLLAVAAIATAVALPVVLLSVGGGVSSHERSALESSGFEITVSAPGTHGVGNSHALTREIDGVPNVAAASPALSSAVDLFGPTGVREPALAEGVLPGPFLATLSPSERSAFPSPLPLGDPDDSVHFANGTYEGPATNDILLAGPTASALGVGIGGTIGVADDANATSATPYTVTGEFGTPSGVLGPIAGFAVIVPLSDLQVLTGEARANGTTGALLDASDTVEVSLSGTASTNPSDVQEAANAIQALVPYYGVTTLSDQVVELDQANAVLTGFYLALSATAIVIGLLFLTLVLLRRVEAERRSIGIRRAIGLPRWSIVTGLVGRAAAIATSGVVAGVAGGWIAILVLRTFGSGEVPVIAGLAVFDPRTLGELGVGTVLLCLLASAAAARAALRLPLAEALR